MLMLFHIFHISTMSFKRSYVSVWLSVCLPRRQCIRSSNLALPPLCWKDGLDPQQMSHPSQPRSTSHPWTVFMDPMEQASSFPFDRWKNWGLGTLSHLLKFSLWTLAFYHSSHPRQSQPSAKVGHAVVLWLGALVLQSAHLSWNPDLVTTSCVTWTRWLTFSKSPVPRLCNGVTVRKKRDNSLHTSGMAIIFLSFYWGIIDL